MIQGWKPRMAKDSRCLRKMTRNPGKHTRSLTGTHIPNGYEDITGYNNI
jgi:hypothetical protein